MEGPLGLSFVVLLPLHLKFVFLTAIYKLVGLCWLKRGGVGPFSSCIETGSKVHSSVNSPNLGPSSFFVVFFFRTPNSGLGITALAVTPQSCGIQPRFLAICHPHERVNKQRNKEPNVTWVQNGKFDYGEKIELCSRFGSETEVNLKTLHFLKTGNLIWAAWKIDNH